MGWWEGAATGCSLHYPNSGLLLRNKGQMDKGGISGAQGRHRLVLGKDRGHSRNRILAFPGIPVSMVQNPPS